MTGFFLACAMKKERGPAGAQRSAVLESLFGEKALPLTREKLHEALYEPVHPLPGKTAVPGMALCYSGQDV